MSRCGYFSSKNNSGVKDVDYLWRIWPNMPESSQGASPIMEVPRLSLVTLMPESTP